MDVSFYSFQARNKPIEPPKQQEKAPFFLPSVPVPSGQIIFESNALPADNGVTKLDNVPHNNKNLDTLSHFSQLLRSYAETENCESCYYLISSH